MVYERLKGGVYFSAGLIRHAHFGMEPTPAEYMPAEYMAARARAIATARPHPGGGSKDLADAFDTDEHLYELHVDDAAVIATAMGRRTL